MSELNEFIKVRLDKLKALKEKGINPYPAAAFEIKPTIPPNSWKNTRTCKLGNTGKPKRSPWPDG